jgi:hypothetical protein
MLLQFKVVEDGSLWSCDTDKLRYARLARSLVDIAENPSDEPAVEEFGELKSMNPLVEAYRMEGRERTTEGPGCGLTSIVIAVRILDDTVDIGVRANVPISDVINVKPIRKVVCEVLG